MSRTGWPSGKLQSSGHEIFETEKQLADSYPVRKVKKSYLQRFANNMYLTHADRRYSRRTRASSRRDELHSYTLSHA
jgi:hypothetical protein